MSVSSTISHDASRSQLEPKASLLSVRDLTVKYQLGSDALTAVDGVSFSIGAGEIVGLLGESGCGKTTTAMSLLRLLPENARVSNGSVSFRGRDLLTLTEGELQKLRGAAISVIFQDSSGLNPVMRVGTQVIEVLRAHCDCNLRQAREKVKSIFDAVGLTDFERIFLAYPHQLSGGQRQRITVAQALICEPSLVVADEPTAHVDSQTAEEILTCLRRLRNDKGTSSVIITHDPELLASVADRVIVMYAGQVVEDCRVEDLFPNPLHPYTRALLECAHNQSPIDDSAPSKKRFSYIPGNSPDPLQIFQGCSFAARCADRMPECDSRRPMLLEQPDGRLVRCFKYEDD